MKNFASPSWGRAGLFALGFACTMAIAALTACDLDFMKSADSLKADARKSMEIKNFSEAASIAQRITEKAPADYEGFFLLAQAKAQAGDKNAAIVALEQAIKSGLKDDEQIDKNNNLDPIKSMVAYSDLMSASFPSRRGVSGVASTDGPVSIRETNGKQVIRAGDIVIEVPADK